MILVQCRRWGSADEFPLGKQPGRDIYLEYSSDKYMGESRAVLRITKLRRSDDGLYECIARNTGEPVHRVGHVAVEYAPTFNHMKSLPIYTWNEQTANLSCWAEGKYEEERENLK